MANNKCRGCGQQIIWITTVKGKKMPCNPTPVPYWWKEKAIGKIVTMSGEVYSCEFDGPRDKLTGFGYISHFSTCPQARVFRRK